MGDREEIRSLQDSYAETFDSRDAERFAQLYSEDATLVDPGGREIHGREKLEKLVRNTPPGGATHHPGDSTIEISGDRATAKCRYRATLPNGGEMTGSYEDEYVRTTDGWRISRRRVLIDR